MRKATKSRGRYHPPQTSFRWRSAVLLVAPILGCSGVAGSGPSQPLPPGIIVSISPPSASVLLGATTPFTATVTNSSNTNVTWSVNGIPGGNSSVGTITSAGFYTAPAILPSPPTLAVQATSAVDLSKSATSGVTISSAFSLTVAGPNSVAAHASAAFTATLAPAPNSNPSQLISWSVAGAGCTGAACGSISPRGVYTAPALPPSPPVVQIVATPQADPSKAASVSVTIISAVSVSLSPTAATVALGAAQPFQAAVTGAGDTTVTWDVNGVVGGNPTVGTILNSQTNPDITTYTAPQNLPAGGSVTVRARSNADPSASASASVMFSGAISVTLSPASATRAINHAQTFTVQVNNTPDQNVVWTVNGIPGGNPTQGQICVAGSSPCRQISPSNSASVDYLAPTGLPAPNPVTITATSQADTSRSASASVTVLPHILVSVFPGSLSLAGGTQQRFSATAIGTDNQQVIWTVSGSACAAPGVCGSIDSTGLYTAPATVPFPGLINVVATSAEDTTQSGAATVTITAGPIIARLAPTSAYAGSAGGFTLLASGSNFSSSAPGPASAILVTGTARTTSCVSTSQCTTSLSAADLASAANLAVQLQNPDGTLSNTRTFVVLAPGSGAAAIPLTPASPSSSGNDIVVVDLTTNGGSGAAANVSLNIAAMGSYSVATSSCTLAGSPVILQRPSAGTVPADLCVFSVSGLDPSFTYTISGPATPDITVTNRAPLGLGIVHLTLQVPATAAAGPRTLFVQNPEGDMAAGTGAIEVR